MIVAILLTAGQCALKLWLPRMMEDTINNGVLKASLDYVRANGLDVTAYQDPYWEPVPWASDPAREARAPVFPKGRRQPVRALPAAFCAALFPAGPPPVPREASGPLPAVSAGALRGICSCLFFLPVA